MALAGLLHDIGKFAQRAGVKPTQTFEGETEREVKYLHALLSDDFVAQHVPTTLRAGLSGPRRHHRPQSRQDKIINLADRLSSCERYEEEVEISSPADTPLMPIFRNIRLVHERGVEETWAYNLAMLVLARDAIFPTAEPKVDRKTYDERWNAFTTEAKRLGKLSLEKPAREYIISLLALLRRHTSLMPSATPWQTEKGIGVLPDVSLYDHLKVTAAIAACLEVAFDDAELSKLGDSKSTPEEPIALLLRGDISGIQNFIYRVARAEEEASFEHVAKRLRGRSFYLALLTDVIADWLIRKLGLTPANILFAGGGRFDLLIPLGTERALAEPLQALEGWLLAQFQGELGVQTAIETLRPADFCDMRRAIEAVEAKLEMSKNRKWASQINRADFFAVGKEEWHSCRVCRLTSLPESGICSLCREHEKIGSTLPHITHLAFVYGKAPSVGHVVQFGEAPFDTSVALLNEARKEVTQFCDIIRGTNTSATLYTVGSTDFLRDDLPVNLASSFRFLANAAPVNAGREALCVEGADPVQPGDVLHFEAIAELSTGAKRIGILKADVDHLGLLFGEGLRPLTISRQAALSSSMEVFFLGWVGKICESEFNRWKEAEGKNHPWQDKVNGLFYILYAGGDDLFVVGPWDTTLRLAQALQSEFSDFTCHNPDVTISAGYAQVKPHFPVQRFAALVSKAEEKAKSAGRNRITAFDQTVPWVDGAGNFASLLQLALDLSETIAQKNIPRTLIHDLGRLHRQHALSQDGGVVLKPMWTPRLHYALARRLSQEMQERFNQRILSAMASQAILLPVSIASLITRKE